jgi:UDP-N-acetylmuramoyl-L-alanyl-D-glutamate--2,6-diaminopimelate ligase
MTSRTAGADRGGESGGEAGRGGGRRSRGAEGSERGGASGLEVRQGGAGFSGDPVAAMLSRAEPSAPRVLGELISRLDAGGQLRGVSRAVPTGTAAGTVEVEPAPGARAVSGVAFDSREVIPGCVFVAIAGDHADGHDFVEAAAGLGAVAAIVERKAPGLPLPQIVVGDTRLALATAAAWWYGDPSLSLGVVGVTGTDGKTTTAFLTAAVLERAGISAGLLTTAEIKIGEVRGANPEHVTTPQAPRLQRALRAMAEAGNEAAVVETTSHGLALRRVAEIVYDIAIFTNLTHEHLELHGTFEAYRDAKLGLFRGLAANPAKSLRRPWPRTAIVNMDDPAGALFAEVAAAAGAGVITYGAVGSAAVRAVAVEESGPNLRVEVATPRWRAPVDLQLTGRFNVHNALAAVALGEALELDRDVIRSGLGEVAGVPGRMERIDRGQPFSVVVDYAHSPASLQKVLDLLGPFAASHGGGLICVFGSAGERDVQKRPMMGRIAGERCRLVVITDEDPRGEDSQTILDEIAAGAQAAGRRRGGDLLCIADRREAIATALSRARPGDVVLLAGKGHEQSIIMSDGPREWDERREAVRALELLGYRNE